MEPSPERTQKHVRFLQGNIVDLMRRPPNNLTLPTLFEYWSALQLTLEKNVPFTVWKDIDPNIKRNHKVPHKDMGVDLTTDDFKTLVQCKFYSEMSCINWGGFGTFLGFPCWTKPFPLDKTFPCEKHIKWD